MLFYEEESVHKMKEKNQSISTIRMLCTLSVVALHITQQYEKIVPWIHVVTDWLNLGLVMFFCISAFLYSRRNIVNSKRWFIRRYATIAVSSLITGVLSIFVFSFLGMMNPNRISNTLFSCLGFQIWTSDKWIFQQLWFLSYILFCYLSIPVIQIIPCEKWSNTRFWINLCIGIVLAHTLTLVLEKLIGIELFSMGILLRFYIPYFLFRRYDNKQLRTIFKIASIPSILCIAIAATVRYTDFFRLSPAISELVFIYAQTISGIVLFFWIYLGVSKLSLSTRVLRLSDSISYEVYLTHCLFIGYSTSLITYFNFKVEGVLFSILLTIISSVVVHFLSSKAFELLKLNVKA